jgi:hypothetical protein
MKEQPLLRFVVASLGAWRLTHLLAYEDGPLDAVAVLRGWLGTGFLGSLMDCFQCLSLWTAAPLAYWVVRDVREWPVAWCAISGAACIIENAGNGPVIMQPAPAGEH